MNKLKTEAVMSPSRGKNKRLGRRIMVYLLYLLVGYALWCTFLYFYQDRMIFFPHAVIPSDGPPEGVERLTIPQQGGGQVHAWFYPAPGANTNTPAPVVIFFHGNAELIDYQDRIVTGYRRMGFSVLLPEYRGYGRCAGKPSQKAILEDNLRFYEILADRADIDPTRIVYHGRSLGGGPAFDLAAQRKPAAIVAESTFISIASMAQRYLVPTILSKHPFRNDRIIKELDIPILIFHGNQDRVIPVRHGRTLKSLAKKGQYVEFDAGHNNFPGEENEPAYWQALKKFMEETGIIR